VGDLEKYLLLRKYGGGSFFDMINDLRNRGSASSTPRHSVRSFGPPLSS
jgi:hypothetical protein